MNIAHISEPHEINEQHHIKNQLHWRTSFNCLAPLISIALPMLIHFIFEEDRFEENPFLRLITVLLPLSYSVIQYSALLHTNWKESTKPEDTTHKALHYILNLLLLTFVVISIFSITVFTLDKWDYAASFFYSIVLPSLLIPPVYLFSTSCSFISGQIGFRDTGTDIFIDILILICDIVNVVLVYKESEFLSVFRGLIPGQTGFTGTGTNILINTLVSVFDIVNRVLVYKESKYYLYSAIILFVFILIRILTEKHCPSGKNSLLTAPWRIVVFVSILILAILVFTLIVHVSIKVLNDHLNLPGELNSLRLPKADE
ncbi:DUF2463 domain-containing protein [Encephalitozoon cuniculi]|nr:DUF2463 domain-containing protein [Encephalitozoon cuniculi]